MKLPTEIKIIDVVYSVEYVDKPSDVDIYKRESYWGQCDYWTRSIRIYKADRSDQDVWHTIWHEVLRAITEHLKMEKTTTGSLTKDEAIIDLLATGINSVMADNDFDFGANEKKK